MTKKILFILMPKNYRDEEFYDPYNMLVEQHYQVDVAGFSKKEAVGINGYKYTPNLILDNLKNKDLDNYDALVIPGGPNSVKYLWNNKRILEIIKYFYDNKKIISAICYAVIPLVQSGILKNKEATVYLTETSKSIFQKNNVIFSDQGCVTLEKEKIITSQGPAFAKEFGTEIINLLEKE